MARRSTKRPKLTDSEVTKLNEAIQTLHDYCAKGLCLGCPFEKDKRSPYDTSCKFGSTYPELWEDLEIKDAEDHE